MSVVLTKNKNGSLKGYRVVIQRQGKLYIKSFPKTKEKEAIAYNEALIAKLPGIRRPSKYSKQDSNNKPKRYKDPPCAEKNGCTIYRSINDYDRCDKNQFCKHYFGKDGCLMKAAKRSWPGFTNKLPIGGAK